MIKADSMTGIAETTMETDGNGEMDGNGNGVHVIGDGTTTTVTRISDGMVIGQGIRDGLVTNGTKVVNGK